MQFRLLLVLLVLVVPAFSQPEQSRYFIGFNAKDVAGFSIDRPESFLSARSLARRQKQNIPVTIRDYPVRGSFVRDVQATGAKIICSSKWLNGVVVETSGPFIQSRIAALPFVKVVRTLYTPTPEPSRIRKFSSPEIPGSINEPSWRVASFNYGISANQVTMLHCDYLHDSGYDGFGKIIAVLDAGFLRVDSLDAFDSLRANNRILGTWDFVDNESEVFNDDNHGMEVLSCMAANMPGVLVGTAPGASYFLLRSEDAGSESIAEEYYWAAAAEYADSAGADIISTSLSYTTFDDPTQDHTYSDMNGHTTVAALAANHAASAGMLVVASAGNYGAGPWNYIGTPADADSALAIGAVDAAGVRWPLSSKGPSSDGDVKPNVVAQGDDAAVYYQGNLAGYGDGTSFSAPILAGAAACLWQAYDSLSNMQIFHAIEASASQFASPDTMLGYGIPNFMSAFTLLHSPTLSLPVPEGIVKIYPNPFRQEMHIIYNAVSTTRVTMNIVDVMGRIVTSEDRELYRGIQEIEFNMSKWSKGVYFVSIYAGELHFTQSVIKY